MYHADDVIGPNGEPASNYQRCLANALTSYDPLANVPMLNEVRLYVRNEEKT